MPRKDDPVDRAFSALVRDARSQAGLSLVGTATAAGLSDGKVVAWVEAGNGCTLRTAARLARLFEISLDAVVDLELAEELVL